ncbi:hypothetical protein HXX76_006001 [Chlamydomonas incerta]|uniref:RRM domain-containing protein n=1 Tax=Chlamydomonas incerta TaxID=51695 RepID=A0A835TFK3_CHLIN|nr:hypothetical protein HXX76_006001 [Chlamydomonas incerta]|eukprot:KAG2437346.1 hypothetical protein HXX76_006001 [Chlamydomonas incerta]
MSGTAEAAATAAAATAAYQQPRPVKTPSGGRPSWADMAEDSENDEEQAAAAVVGSGGQHNKAFECAGARCGGVDDEDEDADDAIVFDDGDDAGVLSGPTAAAAAAERAAAMAAADAALEAESLLMEACAVGMRGSAGGSFGGGAHGGRAGQHTAQPPAFGRSSYSSSGDMNYGEGSRLQLTAAQQLRGQPQQSMVMPPQLQPQHIHPWEVRHLWLGNLLPTTTGAQLERLFAPYGPLESVRVFADRNFAFVNFMTAQPDPGVPKLESRDLRSPS